MSGLGDFFKKIGKLFSALGEIGHGMVDIGDGLLDEVTGLPKGAFYGAIDSVVFIQYIWEFSFTNFICGMQMLKNLPENASQLLLL